LGKAARHRPTEETWMMCPEPCCRTDRQNRRGDIEEAEEIHLHLVAHLIDRDFLDGTEQAIAGIVDLTNIEPPEGLCGGCDRCEDRLTVGHIERQREEVGAELGRRDRRGRRDCGRWRRPLLALSRAARANSLPKPRLAPVMNQIFDIKSVHC